jgi:DNA (cytosine-5)-methyltransferase 1
VSAIYNEIDPLLAEWLRNLMRAELITEGTVDTRDIADVEASDLVSASRVHLFAGIGLWDLSLRWAGWPEDMRVWTASCPCQPFSAAGQKQAELDDRHLWPQARRLIAECGPPAIFGEQVASASGRSWFAAVRDDLEALGYAVGCADLPAACIGASHRRQRLWWVAYADSFRREAIAAAWLHDSRPRRNNAAGCDFRLPGYRDADAWERAVELGLPVPGVCGRLDDDPVAVVALRAFGNAIVPELAASFIRAAMEAVYD